MPRRPRISRSASGEGERLKAAMIHCSFGISTSKARIAAPPSQFTTTSIRSTTYTIGSAADDAVDLDMIHDLLFFSFAQNMMIGWPTRSVPPAVAGGLMISCAILRMILKSVRLTHPLRQMVLTVSNGINDFL